MAQVKGVVEKLFSKEVSGKYGKQFQVGITVEDTRYGGFLKSLPAGLEEGAFVTFSAVQSGEYLNFDAKSLKVSEPQEPKPVQSKAPAAARASAGGYSNVGVAVGHAINNGVQLAVAAGLVPGNADYLKAVHGYAVDILILSAKLASQYDAVQAKAAKAIRPTQVESEPDEQGESAASDENEEATPEEVEEAPKTAPKAAKAKPATKPAGKVVTPVTKAKASPIPKGAPAFDDDIPF